MVDLILPEDKKFPRCSRCRVVYGELELTLRFPDGRVGVMRFSHKPGCKWIASKTGKDRREWLVREHYLPNYH